MDRIKTDSEWIEEIESKKASLQKRRGDEVFIASEIEVALSQAKTRDDRVEILRRVLQYVPWGSLQYAKRNATRVRR